MGNKDRIKWYLVLFPFLYSSIGSRFSNLTDCRYANNEIQQKHISRNVSVLCQTLFMKGKPLCHELRTALKYCHLRKWALSFYRSLQSVELRAPRWAMYTLITSPQSRVGRSIICLTSLARFVAFIHSLLTKVACVTGGYGGIGYEISKVCRDA